MKKTKWMKLFLPLLLLSVTILLNVQNVKAGEFGNATAISIGQRVYGESYGSGDICYKFTTTGERAYYSLTGSVISGGGRYFDLYAGPDTSYPMLLSGRYVSNGSNGTWLLDVEPNKTYYIVVPSDEACKIAVQVNKIVDDYANDFSGATLLNLGTVKEGNIEVDSKDCDFFKFTTSGRNSFYEVTLYGIGAKTVECAIYEGGDASYNHVNLDAYPGRTDTDVRRLQKGHTYYIKVWGGYWNDATRYKIGVKEILDDASDDFKGAVKLTNKKTKSGQIQVRDDVDFFRFKTAKKTTAYQFSVRNTSTAGLYVTIYSRNDSTSAITQVNNYYVGYQTSKKFWLNLKKNHTYYVKVKGDQNVTYKLNFTDSPTALKTAKVKSFKVNGYYSYYRGGYTYISWQNTSQFAGYELYRASSKNGPYKKIKTLKNTSYYYDYGAKRKSYNYYKIRYYVKNNGKVVGGKWSTVKKVYVK